MKIRSILRWAAVGSLVATNAHAFSNYSISDLSSLSQDAVGELIETVAIGTEHRAYMPASALGWVIGLDVGVEVTAVRLPNYFRDTVSSVSGVSSGSIPELIPIPKLNVHKGLPFGIDVGMSFISYQGDVRIIGGDLQWSPFDGVKAIPFNLALRLSGTSERLWYISSTTWQTDVLISEDLFFLEPYVGTGLQFWSGSIDVPTGLPAASGLPTNVTASNSGTNAHFFVGIPLKLALFWLTAEADFSTSGVTTFGTKFSLNF